MDLPLVSIVIPVYKSKAFLPKLVDSLTNQTYPHWEAIFVNDGCPEDSGSLCDSYASQDARIKVIHQKNSGAVAALNRGMGFCSGSWVMFLDADDWIDYSTIEKAIQIAVSEHVDVVMWGNIKEFAEKSVPYPLFFDTKKKIEGQEFKWLQRRLFGLQKAELSNPIATDALSSGWAKLYRKEILDQHQIQWTATQEVGSSDVLFNVQYFAKAKSAYYLPEHLHHYNKENPNGLTKTYGYSLVPKFLNLYQALSLEIKKHFGDKKEFNEALDNRLALSSINVGLSLNFKNDWRDNHRYIAGMVSNSTYKNALRKLELKYIPFHFRIYLWLAKFEFSSLILILAFFMQKLKNR